MKHDTKALFNRAAILHADDEPIANELRSDKARRWWFAQQGGGGAAGDDRFGSELRAPSWKDTVENKLYAISNLGDLTTTLTKEDPKWKWALGTIAGMMIPMPGGKGKGAIKGTDLLHDVVATAKAGNKNLVAKKLQAIWRLAEKQAKKAGQVADKATDHKNILADATGHLLDPDLTSGARQIDLTDDAIDGLKKVFAFTDDAAGAGARSDTPTRIAELAKQTKTGDFNALTDLYQLDPKMAERIYGDIPNRTTLKNEEEGITPPELLFLANARRVASGFIANAFMTDDQRKAYFARQGGGGTRSVVVKKDPAKDFRQGGSGDLNRPTQGYNGPSKNQYDALAVGGGGNFTQAANPKYDTPAWKEWKSKVQAAMARAPGGYTDKAGFHASDGTFIPSPQESAGKAGGAGGTPTPPGGDNLFAGGNPYFDERTGKYLTDAQRAEKDRQMGALMRALEATADSPPAPQPFVPGKPFDASTPPATTPEPPTGGGSPNMPPQGGQPAPAPTKPPNNLPQPNHVAPPAVTAPEVSIPVPQPAGPIWTVPGNTVDPQLPRKKTARKSFAAELQIAKQSKLKKTASSYI